MNVLLVCLAYLAGVVTTFITDSWMDLFMLYFAMCIIGFLIRR